MRDGQIFTVIEQVDQLVKQTNGNTAVMSDQITNLSARIGALERMLFGSRVAMLTTMIACLISPRKVKEIIMNLHHSILVNMRNEARRINELQRKEAEKPKIIAPTTNGVARYAN